jgi:ACR3 family arsenite efflux pump ArsB
MSAQREAATKKAFSAPMSAFERFLTVWVFLCIVIGIAFGQLLPGIFQAIGRMEIANFFELAVAAAISLFGFNSGAALATVVGVLIEVPVMLVVVNVVNSSRDWYARGI